ncbi:unnamed protein product [Rotaria socialis]|uniref:Uncharacterized protein n=1 Tax=Rotaria socialis TaxID=392032 RepID=A0A818PBM4_9BILA|nr:unnamed protein product [Rotaria socialis]CAF4806889.1 unnamed protein product [Rotaria socialis]
MQDYSEVSLLFRDFLDQQATTSIMTICVQMCAQYENVFQLSNGILMLRNSSIKWPPFIQAGFNSKSIRETEMFFGIPEYEAFCRLVSYNIPIYSTHQVLIDILKNSNLLIPRQLHDLELQIFNIGSLSSHTPKYVKSFDQFMNNFNKLFFLWVCGLLISLRLFLNQTVENLLQQTQFIDLQFIFIKCNYSPDELLTNLDIDVAQFSFNGESLVGTMAAIQAIRTLTFINYALNNDDKDYAPVAIRIGKYVKRGFTFLKPIHFNFQRFEASPTHISNQYIRSHILLS